MYTRPNGTICAHQEEALLHNAQLSRYRNPWPRQMTPDRVEKRTTAIIMQDFCQQYKTKLTKWAKTLCRTWSVPAYVHEDCVQNAFLRVYVSIDGWHPDKGNLWTYTYLGMRKAMMCIIREYHHNKPYSHKPLHRFVENAEELIERNTQSAQDTAPTLEEITYEPSLEPLCMYERIGIRRIVAARIKQHPKQMKRLIDSVVSEHSFAELARRSPKRISRQGYYNSIQHARRLVRADLEVTYG